MNISIYFNGTTDNNWMSIINIMPAAPLPIFKGIHGSLYSGRFHRRHCERHSDEQVNDLDCSMRLALLFVWADGLTVKWPGETVHEQTRQAGQDASYCVGKEIPHFFRRNDELNCLKLGRDTAHWLGKRILSIWFSDEAKSSSVGWRDESLLFVIDGSRLKPPE